MRSEEGETIVEEHTKKLAKALQEVDQYVPTPTYFTGRWALLKQAESVVTSWDTGFDTEILQFIGKRSVQYPDELVSVIGVNSNLNPGKNFI